jgi:flagellar biosynthetic protein FliR
MTGVLPRLGESQLAGFFLVLARLSPLFVLAPLFSSHMIPPRARGIAAVALAIGLTPLALRGQRVPTAGGGLVLLLGKEMLVGLGFAFVIGALFAAVTVAGSFLDASIGFSFGALIDPLTGSQSTVLAQLYGLLGVMVFIAIGGDAWLIQGIARTYDLVPLLAFPDLGALTAGALQALVQVFVAALEIAAPVLVTVLLTDAAFGMVARVVPQMNVFAVGFPAKAVVGLLLVAATLPFMAGWISDELQVSVRSALESLRVAG